MGLKDISCKQCGKVISVSDNKDANKCSECNSELCFACCEKTLPIVSKSE